MRNQRVNCFLFIVTLTTNPCWIQFIKKTLKEKRLKVDVCTIREMTDKKEIESMNWRSSEKQLADCLTKVSASCTKLISA